MADMVKFETPENVHVEYQMAGLGSRFVAWFVDSMLLGLIMFVLFIVLVIGGAGLGDYADDVARSMADTEPGKTPQLPFYVWGIAILVMGFAGFVYFGLSEILMEGQTVGKRQVSIRVVKAGGFSLDPGSILLRNILRVVDHIPLFWLVPLLTERSQRIGDLVAGTVVIKEEKERLGGLRQRLLRRPQAEAAFRFDATTLSRARPSDIEAIEKILERLGGLQRREQHALIRNVIKSISERLQVDTPDVQQGRRFLEDLLAAEYRRQDRMLG